MAKMIQIRNVPDRMHRALVQRARGRGLTLTDYCQSVLERELSRPPAEEVFERIAGHAPVDIGAPVAAVIRREREEAGRQ
jgi:hypothetical protein